MSQKKSKYLPLIDKLLLAAGLILLVIASFSFYKSGHQPAPVNCPTPFVAQYI